MKAKQEKPQPGETWVCREGGEVTIDRRNRTHTTFVDVLLVVRTWRTDIFMKKYRKV